MTIIPLLLLLLLSGCSSKMVLSQDPEIATLQKRIEERKLTSLNFIDRNGLSETITASERLKTHEQADYLSPQSYQKVLRVFAKDKSGKALAIITSYYPTGQVKQYLEVVNGRAHGTYLEWHGNGQKKLKAEILGGHADLDEKATSSWSFDKTSYCWNESGTLIAEIPYVKGVLEGIATYYHADGSLEEKVPYSKGEIHGEMRTFSSNGICTEITNYSSGLKTGPSLGFWNSGEPEWKEVWDQDLLQEGTYYDQKGSLISEVKSGTGQRCVFSEKTVSELHEYREGKEDGKVLIFDEQGTLIQSLHVKDGVKHGEEVYYKASNPRLSIEWYEGNIHGIVKTWYDNGSQESQREMSHNAKQGLLTAWYRDGSLMMIEEYEKDRLRRGDYLKRGEMTPVSKVTNGNGTATIYDADGTFIHRIEYQEGKAVDEESSHKR